MFKSKKILYTTNILILGILFFTIGINQVIAYRINKVVGAKSLIEKVVKLNLLKTGVSDGLELDGSIVDDAIKLAISNGLPDIYGEELGVSFDQVQEAINIMKQFDPTYGKENKITLTGEALSRYIDVALKISCEYCCGAKSIIREDGTGACGCAHSQAMRGLAAYLIVNHGDEYTNDEILRELARWKGMYFPKQMIKKMTEQLQNGNYTPDTASLVLNVDLPDYGGEGSNAPLPSEIESLPTMVGGC